MAEQKVLVLKAHIQAELHALSLLFELTRHLTDRDSQIMLSQALMEDTQHLATLLELATTLDAVPIPFSQLRMTRSIAGLRPRKNVLDLLTLSLVAKERAGAKYASGATSADEPQERRLFIALCDDEARHSSWLKKSLEQKAQERGTVQEVSQLILRCQRSWQEADEAVSAYCEKSRD